MEGQGKAVTRRCKAKERQWKGSGKAVPNPRRLQRVLVIRDLLLDLLQLDILQWDHDLLLLAVAAQGQHRRLLRVDRPGGWRRRLLLHFFLCVLFNRLLRLLLVRRVRLARVAAGARRDKCILAVRVVPILQQVVLFRAAHQHLLPQLDRPAEPAPGVDQRHNLRRRG